MYAHPRSTRDVRRACQATVIMTERKEAGYEQRGYGCIWKKSWRTRAVEGRVKRQAALNARVYNGQRFDDGRGLTGT